jgi:flagellar motor switch protein FliG
MIKILIIIIALLDITFAQVSKDVDVLEYKLKYENIVKRQIEEILSKIIKEEQFVVTVTVEITPETEKRTQQITKTTIPDNVDPTLWKIYGEDKRQFEEKIVESKHKINKISAVIILDEKIQEDLINEIKDSILRSLKDINAKNLEIKKQRLIKELSLLKFFEKNKNYIICFIAILTVSIFLFGPLRNFLKGIVKGDLHGKSNVINVEVKRNEQEKIPTINVEREKIEKEIQSHPIGETKSIAKPEFFSFIRKENLENLTYILQNESPEMVSLVISYLKEDEAAEVIKRLPLELQTKVAVTLADVKQTKEEDVLKIEEKIKKKINFLVGGIKRFASILEKVDSETREDILRALEKESPEIVNKIREEIFTFEDIIHIDDPALQLILREVKVDTLARALVNAPPEVIEKVKRNISSGAVSLLQEEMSLVGYITPVKIKEERDKIISIIKNFEEKGNLVLKKEKKKLEKVKDLDLNEEKVDLDYYTKKESKNVLSLRKILKNQEKKGDKEQLYVPKKDKI